MGNRQEIKEALKIVMANRFEIFPNEDFYFLGPVLREIADELDQTDLKIEEAIEEELQLEDDFNNS